MKEFKAKPYQFPQGVYLYLSLIMIVVVVGCFVAGILMFINIVQLLCLILFFMVWSTRNWPSLVVTDSELVSRNNHKVYWHFPIQNFAAIKHLQDTSLLIDIDGNQYPLQTSTFSATRWHEIEDELVKIK
ncbi:hypothetical protein [Thalassotalea crassostreae]|uniref:hypothetical protein n=1 Tax=Thalassotalea crassostreae TaxID=1763536 RepID=UPI0008392C41|nr:hypothetical protein [Thalassotalea crassostreae]